MMNLLLLIEDVKKLAVETGAFLRKEREHFRAEEIELKNAHDYVSYVDKESERRIVNRLRELLPEAGFLTEEGTASRNQERLYWVIDPLDGTTNYIHNSAPYCVSIALRTNEEVLLGVVYECCRDELFWATHESSAYLNDKVIQVSSVNKLDQAFIALGFPYNSEKYHPMAVELVTKLYGRVGGLRLLGAAAAELCYVAAGRFEARIEGYLGEWDYTAGMLILLRAGGKVCNFSGGDDLHQGGEVIATNGEIDQEFLKMIQTIHFYPHN